MRIVPAATPVCSARSLIASFCTRSHTTALRPIRIRRSRKVSSSATRAPILVTGATGYVGSQLVDELRRPRPPDVRTLSRRGADKGDAPQRRRALRPRPARGARGRRRPPTTSSTRWARGGDFAAKDRQAAVNFAEARRDADVERVVYLGGLGADGLRAPADRHEVARPAARPAGQARLRPRGDDHRPRQRLLRHPRAPGPAAAGDDRAALAGHEDAAGGARRT